jgi:protein TonB
MLLAREDGRPRQIALLAALLIHILLLTVTIPSFRTQRPTDEAPKKVMYLARWVPPPPPRPIVRPAAPRQELASRRIPVPDPTPEEPEPVREPLPEPEPIWIPPDVEVIIGTPEPPPLLDAPVRAGFGGVTYPILIPGTRVLPDYPELARVAKVTGVVVLEAVIRKNGAVADVRVLRAPAAKLGFEEAAMKAVLQWRYKPGVQDGRPVDVYFTIVVEFEID